MPKSQTNINIELALNTIKKDIVKSSGSCFFIYSNDGEIFQTGGGDAGLMKDLLILAIGQIEKDKTIPRGLIT
jgi:hypothetical protein